MRYKKRTAALMLTLPLLAAALCSCHGSRSLPDFVIPEEFDEKASYEITFWAKNDTNKVQSDIYKKAISDFEELYPGIHVNMRLYTDYGRIYNDVITNISTATTPDVCITYPDHIATYMKAPNVVVPLDELAADPDYGLGGSALKYEGPKKEDLIEKFVNECRLSGTLYALPFMRSTEALYINEDLVKTLGYEVPDVVTWDFVWDLSEKAMEKDEKGDFVLNGQKVLIPFIYKSTDNMMITRLRQLDAPYSKDDGSIEIFNDTTTRLLEEIGQHAATGAFSTFKVSSYPGNFLNAGQCIFAVDSTAGSTWMGTDAPLSDIAEENKKSFKTLVRPVPQEDPGHPVMISQGPSVCVFNKEDPGQVLAAWLFAQFLLTDEVQTAYAETEGYVPVTQKARDTAEYRDYLAHAGDDANRYYRVKMDASGLLLENTDNTFTTPVFAGSASVRDAAGALVENVVKASRRGTKVDEAFIRDMYEDVSGLYKLDNTGRGILAKEDLGPMPAQSKALLAALALIWCLIAAYYIYGLKGRRKS
ncbi:MAG: ABC transporter substrate-binding protein [Lachnospiraceae bacterium]|nr:ABC transporter substrate-binding protein [Lachnospiraceae bacterium]